MEGAWSCYRSGHFNEGRMVMLQKSPVLMEGEWLCYGGGQFNEGSMIMLQKCSL